MGIFSTLTTIGQIAEVSISSTTSFTTTATTISGADLDKLSKTYTTIGASTTSSIIASNMKTTEDMTRARQLVESMSEQDLQELDTLLAEKEIELESTPKILFKS